MTWSGLGLTLAQPDGSWPDYVTNYVAINAEFLPKIINLPRLRIIGDEFFFSNSTAANHLWSLGVKSVYPSKYILYGLARSSSAYWPTYYSTYLPKMLQEAQWAQDNNMDAFTVANEVEVDGRNGQLSLTSLFRTSNVTTAVCSAAHNLITGDTVKITGATPSNFNLDQISILVIDSVTFTYANTASDGSATGTLLMRPGIATIVRLIKLLATAAKSVFTRGNIVYSVSQGYEAFWTSLGDLDQLGLNAYTSGDFPGFSSRINTLFGLFGTKLIISEFNIHFQWASAKVGAFGPLNRCFDIPYGNEAARLRDYIIGIGILEAYFYAGWNGSVSDNNSFTVFYNIDPNTGTTVLSGNWKSAYDRLINKRVTHYFFGTQQHT